MTKLTRIPPTPPEAALVVAQRRQQALVDAWLEGRSLRTIAAYRSDLSHFAGTFKLGSTDEAASYLVGLHPGEANGLVLEYRNKQVDAGLAANTVNRRLSSLRSLVKLARSLGHITWALDVDNVKGDGVKDTRGPSTEEVSAMLKVLRGTKNEARDRAVVRLLFAMALRRGEVDALMYPDDVDLKDARLAVLGKGKRKKAWLRLPRAAAADVAAWVRVRGKEPGKLFQLSYRALYDVVSRAGLLAGVKARPHGLRHTAITDALDKTDGDVRRAQKFSRHADVKTLMIYDDNRKDTFGEIAEMVGGDGDD